MTPLSLSSGDLVADRRAAYAEMLCEAGDVAAAADLLREAVALAPGWAAGWYRLGETMLLAGRIAEAAEAWSAVLRLDPADRLGASLRLAEAGLMPPVDAPPSAFVETLFDQYAAGFDDALVGRLGYRVPELIERAIRATGRTAHAHAVDLGCGTGLLGERLRATASFLEGIDISAAMLRRAEAKRLYDRLTRADLQMLAADRAAADLVTAADVFMYVGALDRLVAAVAAMLVPGGLFAFSVEKHDGPEPVFLRPSRRYAHSAGHLRGLLGGAGFAVLSLETAPIRRDRGETLLGLIVVAERLAPAAAAPGGHAHAPCRPALRPLQ
ncbi:methyltransferase domain-containing protein [Aquibium sp. A9E412]|uniref:methyltransferase domain-containing protein n=1 Tax=Aquibium sp. A9E412 TaxID=2976767 RepID=UPI0025B2567C|nr:methyltransferase domain-containing protein [Aquibium sp. A9E412]MDN2567779.1 methyltransferase domain-containing protein [Aquibium sp. A9E412]